MPSPMPNGCTQRMENSHEPDVLATTPTAWAAPGRPVSIVEEPDLELRRRASGADIRRLESGGRQANVGGRRGRLRASQIAVPATTRQRALV